MARANVATGTPLIEAVGQALDIEPDLIKRVLLQGEHEEPLAIYVEMLGTDAMIKKVLTAKVIPDDVDIQCI